MNLKSNKLTKVDADVLNLKEHIIALNRVAKVVKGGRRFSFNAMMVVGDSKEHCIGLGFGKANEVPEAIKKGIQNAKKNMFKVKLNKKNTLSHEIIGKYGSTKVWLKPATEGTGLIAGSTVRLILESAGVHDVLTKVQGSRNSINVARATINALSSLMDVGEIAKRRGKELNEIWD